MVVVAVMRGYDKVSEVSRRKGGNVSCSCSWLSVGKEREVVDQRILGHFKKRMLTKSDGEIFFFFFCGLEGLKDKRPKCNTDGTDRVGSDETQPVN